MALKIPIKLCPMAKFEEGTVKVSDNLTMEGGSFSHSDPLVSSYLNKTIVDQSQFPMANLDNKGKAKYIGKRLAVKIADKLSKFTNTLNLEKHGDVALDFKEIQGKRGEIDGKINEYMTYIYEPINLNKTKMRVVENYIANKQSLMLYDKWFADVQDSGNTEIHGLYFFDNWAKENNLEKTMENRIEYGKVLKEVDLQLSQAIKQDVDMLETINRRREIENKINNEYADAHYEVFGYDVSSNYFEDYMSALVVEANKIKYIGATKGVTSDSYISKQNNFVKRHGTDADILLNLGALDQHRLRKTMYQTKTLNAKARIFAKKDVSSEIKRIISKNITSKLETVTIDNKSNLGEYSVQKIDNILETVVNGNENVPSFLSDQLKQDLDSGQPITVALENFSNELNKTVLQTWRKNIKSDDFLNFKAMNPSLESVYNWLENNSVIDDVALNKDIKHFLTLYNQFDELAVGNSEISYIRSLSQEIDDMKVGIIADAINKEDIKISDILPEGRSLVFTNKLGMKLHNSDGTPLSDKQLSNLAPSLLASLEGEGVLESAKQLYNMLEFNIDEQSGIARAIGEGQYRVVDENIADALMEFESDYVSENIRKSKIFKANSFFRKMMITSVWRVPKWALGNKPWEIFITLATTPLAIPRYFSSFRFRTINALQSLDGNLDAMFDADKWVEYTIGKNKLLGKETDELKVRRKAESFIKKMGKYEGVIREQISTLSSTEVGYLNEDTKTRYSPQHIKAIEESSIAMEQLKEAQNEGNTEKIIKATAKLNKAQLRMGTKLFEKLEFSPRIAMATYHYDNILKSVEKGKTFVDYGGANSHVVKAEIEAGNYARAAVYIANQNFNDYSDAPALIRKMNATLFPFVTFPYFAGKKFISMQRNFYKNIRFAESGSERATAIGKAAWANAIFAGLGSQVWNLVMEAFGLLDRDEEPIPNYMNRKWSLHNFFGFDQATYIPGLGWNNRTAIFDAPLQFIPDPSEGILKSGAGRIASQLFPHIKAPFEIALGTNIIDGSFQKVRPDVSPFSHTLSKAGSYFGSPSESMQWYWKTVNSWMPGSEKQQQAEMWGLAKNLKYNYQGNIWTGENFGYGTKEDKIKYAFKQSLKQADFDSAVITLENYIIHLQAKGDDDSSVKRKVKSLIEGQTIFSGMKQDQINEFANTLSDRQIEIVKQGLLFDEEIKKAFSRYL